MPPDWLKTALTWSALLPAAVCLYVVVWREGFPRCSCLVAASIGMSWLADAMAQLGGTTWWVTTWYPPIQAALLPRLAGIGICAWAIWRRRRRLEIEFN